MLNQQLNAEIILVQPIFHRINLLTDRSSFHFQISLSHFLYQISLYRLEYSKDLKAIAFQLPLLF
jgi:hypothetical protein